MNKPIYAVVVFVSLMATVLQLVIVATEPRTVSPIMLVFK
jgi:hypothetical protein